MEVPTPTPVFHGSALFSKQARSPTGSPSKAKKNNDPQHRTIESRSPAPAPIEYLLFMRRRQGESNAIPEGTHRLAAGLGTNANSCLQSCFAEGGGPDPHTQDGCGLLSRQSRSPTGSPSVSLNEGTQGGSRTLRDAGSEPAAFSSYATWAFAPLEGAVSPVRVELTYLGRHRFSACRVFRSATMTFFRHSSVGVHERSRTSKHRPGLSRPRLPVAPRGRGTGRKNRTCLIRHVTPAPSARELAPQS